MTGVQTCALPISPDPVFALVAGAQGFEVETLLCAGEVVMSDREVRTLGETEDVLTDATEAAETVVERVGLE